MSLTAVSSRCVPMLKHSVRLPALHRNGFALRQRAGNKKNIGDNLLILFDSWVGSRELTGKSRR
jgi:hypothetical protein